ncbi:S-methyl thiohydantoin desulfurase domain-containing protein, partial [Pantoea agglomerans]|uniref:S-methyl thiohydantoin desulfurase domain-containing protein n=1 Tax=Enterobacter agglomerans TaxID=549 RepID=UPI001ABBB052
VEAGGLVAVARNPVHVAYAKKHGASGAIQQAIQVGEALCSRKGERAIDSVVSLLGGKVIGEGTVTEFKLETTGGFDVGTVTINNDWNMTFWNEYMTIEKDGIRYGTFPDLIMTLDVKTGRPIVTAEVEKGQNLAVIVVPKEKLILSST